MVGNEQRDDLRAADGVRDRRDLEPGFLGRCARRAAVAETDDDLDTGVAQVEGVRMTLASEADGRRPFRRGARDRRRDELLLPFERDSFVGGSDHNLLLGARTLSPRRAGETDAAGADQLLQAVRTDELLERVELLG